MYKYLLFDLDDTLLDFKAAEAASVRRVFKEFNIDSSDKTVSVYSNINKRFWERFERGEIERDEIFEGRFKELSLVIGVSFDTKAVCRRYFENLSNCGFTFDGAEELLKLLKGKYVLCAATNGALITQKKRIELSGLEKYFDGGIFISEEIGCKKPGKEFFDYILSSLKNPPKNQVLVLGDSLSSDILGAVNSGLDSCFVNLRNTENNTSLKPTYTVTDLSQIPAVCGL